ncbi:MAG: WbqC family protein [Schleiferiaceae bacterium]
MRVAIMQPYFFPYLGYFQLIQAVDVWVNMDHAAFKKKGFMHKNTVVDEQPIRVPLVGASQNLNTREIGVNLEGKLWSKLKTTLHHKYHKAPYYERAIGFLDAALERQPESLAALNFDLITSIHGFLEMDTQLLDTSIGRTALSRADGMVDIATQLEATTLINPIGGQAIYDKSYFKERGIELQFIQMTLEDPQYQYSIFHHLCHSTAEELRELLDKYELV